MGVQLRSSDVSTAQELHLAPRQPRRGGVVVTSVITSVIAVLAVVGLLLALLRPAVFGMGETRVDSTTIGASFEDIAELSVEEYVFSDVGKFDQKGLEVLGLRVPFTGRNFLVTYDGRVTAGIRDTSAIDVSVGSGAIDVVLPPVEVLSAHINADSVQVYDQSMNPINQIRVDDVTTFIAGQENAARDKAVSQGLLDRAGERTEHLVRSHIAALVKETEQEDFDVRISWAQ
ncbi:DUF4230 domain-containing protein [Corynebacterium coyleae]|uniref:DUF4230 domain-containing protein n=1 Tax=Corynebacterium coyleae TaxID=53374 RepID=A0AAP7CDL1_9CORY|nr:DUF4230 domain-containing protein [Corynebacterium coyleae]